MKVDENAMQIGLNRVAVVAMYRMWMDLSNEERVERVQAIFAENNLEGTLSELGGVVGSLGLSVNDVSQPSSKSPAAMDHGYL